MPHTKEKRLIWTLPLVSGLVGLAFYAFQQPPIFDEYRTLLRQLLQYTFVWVVVIPLIIAFVAYVIAGIYKLFTANKMPGFRYVIWGLFGLFVLFMLYVHINHKREKTGQAQISVETGSELLTY